MRKIVAIIFALAAFTVNAQQSIEEYNSAAEAALKSGDRAKAIELYTVALNTAKLTLDSNSVQVATAHNNTR